MLMLTMTWVILTMIATTPMVLGTKFLPISSTEVASDVAATDEDPGDTDEDSVGDGATKFLPLSATEAACDIAAPDENPSDTDVEKDSVGEDNDAGEDPSDTDEDSVGDGGCYKVLASLLYRACL